MKKLHSTLLAFLLSSTVLFAQNQTKIVAPSPNATAFFGTSTAIHGNTLASGSPRANGPTLKCGKVVVGSFSGTSYTFEQELFASDPDTGDNFGFSTAIYQDVLVVGANQDDAVSPDAGAVYVFRKTGTTWNFEQKITAFDHDTADYFGNSVSIYNNTLLVGAYNDDYSGKINNGSAYVYRYDGTSWVFEQKLLATGSSDYDFFGYAVSIHDSLAVVGAYLDDDMGINSGSAFVYRYNGLSWVTEQKLTASDGVTGDNFGFSIDNNDSTIVIGAYAKNISPYVAAGAVYVFSYDGSSFIQKQRLTAPDRANDDWFGFSIGLSGKTIVSSAFHDDNYGAESGSGYVYRFNGTTWIYELKVYANDADLADEFGQSMAIDALNVLVGAPKNDDSFSNSGSLYLIDLCTYTPEANICLITTDTLINGYKIIAPKPNTTFIDSLILMRNVFGTFVPVGSIAYSTYAEEFTDNSFNLDLEQGIYKVFTKNICGNTSLGSSQHDGILLSATINTSGKAVLTWTDASGFSFPYYRVYRDDNGTGTWNLLAATVVSNTTYTDPTTPTNPQTRYVIQIQKASSCSSPSGSISNAYSNIYSLYVDNLTKHNEQPLLSIFPNPATNEITIKRTTSENTLAYVLNIAGDVLFTTNITSPLQTINISGLENGFYLFRMENTLVSFIKQ